MARGLCHICMEIERQATVSKLRENPHFLELDNFLDAFYERTPFKKQ